ncbi:MAG: DUF1801 domain-containing protein [Myxococcaceae bacterium]|nr:DUF1801 domain-containing protein [Myxococcaceae bacterium]
MTVEDFIAQKVPPPWKGVMAELRMTVKTAVPEANECIKWGQPVYELNGPFAWMKPFCRHVGFGFWRGAELEDPYGILEGTGDRMKHVKITDPENVPIEELDHLIRQAAELNRQKGDPTERR